MLVAGSVAASSLMTSASATIDGDISIVEGGELGPGGITYYDEIYSIGSGQIANTYSGRLTENNLWGICYFDAGTASGYYNKAVTGDKLAEKLYNLHNDDNSVTYREVKIRSTHKVLVTTDNPDETNLSTTDAVEVSEFPATLST